MVNDRLITISVGSSRRSINWQTSRLLLSEFYEKLRVPIRGTETMNAYLGMTKSKQDELKDVGGYTGELSGQRRKAGAIIGRDLITLDYDAIPAGGTNDILKRVDGLGCSYGIYSTRKHAPSAPRLRIIIPLDRTVTGDEYEPLARKMAEMIGMAYADPTTFEVTRLMYWPSCCSDGEYVYTYVDRPMLSADGLLAKYNDWHDVTSWPRHAGETPHIKLAMKQGDPLDKKGIVGSFCRVYDILMAMDTFLPGIYDDVDSMPGRYTYLGGSTTGGAVLYDDAKFLYSHHASDPCSGRLVNAFDLVRLHKFGDLDNDVKENHAHNRLPSYMAMSKLAMDDSQVKTQMITADFGDITAEETSKDPVDWMKELSIDGNGAYQKSIKNIRLMIENLPGLDSVIRRDVFSGKIMIGDDPPWDRWPERKLWGDPDTTALREFLERWFKPSKQDVRDTLAMIADRRSFHPIRNYLNSLVWDGEPRLDTVFIDYMAAPDNPYVRAVTRKCLVAAAARVMNPGIKFDYMVVFIGRQGRGKSMIINKLAINDEWFSDSMATFLGKDAMEAVQGKWLIEIPEMHAFDKSEMSVVKAFVTKKSDYFRAAYAEHAEERPRQCVLFGTTNNRDCLRDPTGNRRFWPVDTGPVEQARLSVYTELEHNRDQIWAEVMFRYRSGELLYLSKELEAIANEVQEDHREKHPWEDSIVEFLNREVPLDWSSWDLDKRMIYWGGGIAGTVETIPRTRVCCREIWQECFGKDLSTLNLQNSRVINSILENRENWRFVENGRCGKPYGVQKAFDRKF